MIVYVSIGNSDDKLSQQEWARFFSSVAVALRGRAVTVHGQWASESASAWQNACWCIEFDPDVEIVDTQGERLTLIDHIQRLLRRIAGLYGQDSIAWAEIQRTIFLGALERSQDEYRATR